MFGGGSLGGSWPAPPWWSATSTGSRSSPHWSSPSRRSCSALRRLLDAAAGQAETEIDRDRGGLELSRSKRSAQCGGAVRSARHRRRSVWEQQLQERRHLPAPRRRAAAAPAAERDAHHRRRAGPACADWIDQCAGSQLGLVHDGVPDDAAGLQLPKDADGTWTEVPSPTMASMPTVATVERQTDRHLHDQPEGGVVRRPADHLRRLQVHVATRSRTARTSTTRPVTPRSTSVDYTNPKVAVVTFKPSPSHVDAALRRRLRHHAVAHPRGARTATR